MPEPAELWGSISADTVKVLDSTAAASGIATATLMENAGRQVARCARTLFPEASYFWIVAGNGNNGGDGLVAARYLGEAQLQVQVSILGDSERLTELSKLQYRRLIDSGLPVEFATQIEGNHHPGAIVVDALLGSGLHSPPRPGIAAAIRALAGRRVLSVDVPSGLDASTGQPYAPTVTAEATCTLAAMKQGLWEPASRAYAGRVFLADIGLSEVVWRRCGLEAPRGLHRDQIIELTQLT